MTALKRYIDPRAVASWQFEEQADSLAPVDVSGTLASLEPPAGIDRPIAVYGTPSGFGREFTRDTARAYVVEDAAGAVRLPRGLAILCMARLDLEDLDDDDVCTIVQRGRGAGPGDQATFGLRVVVLDASARSCRLEMYWQNEAGDTLVVDDGAAFTWPEERYLLLMATREWDDDALVCRYQIDGTRIDGGSSALDCGGALVSDISVGAGMAGAVYENHWDGVIDVLEIINEAAAPEEFEWIWLRMSVDMPAAYEAIRRSVPPDVYSQDPDSRIQRELAVEGMVLGHSKSLARRLRDYHLPGKAWGIALERWEKVTGNAPRAGDSIARRRARVLDHTQNKRGPQIADYQARLAEAFDQEPDDVVILEGDITYTQDFASDPDDALVIAGNATISIAAGVLKIDTGASGATDKDMRYAGKRTEKAALYLMTLAAGRDARVEGKIVSLVGADLIAGIVLGRRDTDEWVWIGQFIESGTTNYIAWMTYKAGALSAVHSLAADWDTEPTFLSLHILEDDTIDVGWGATLDDAREQVPTNIAPAIGSPNWAGFSLVAAEANASEHAMATFDDFLTHTPQGDQRATWYAYRDPEIAGNPDMAWARRIVARKKQAHMNASAISSLGVFCDDPGSGCDREPIGK